MASFLEELNPVARVSGHPETDAEPIVTVIQPRPDWRLIDLADLYRYRELFLILAARDVKVRYKQTFLGATWAVIQPLATMLVFTTFLGPLAGPSAEGPPYSLYVFAGLLPWAMFSSAFNAAAASVVGNQNLITKVYFPRLIIPAAAVGAPLVDFAIGFLLLLGLMFYQGVPPSSGLLFVPVIAALLVLSALGVGSLFAALTVTYRDFRHVVPFLTQLWMFATPIIYLRPEALGPRLRAVLPLNPAFGLISSFRQAVVGGPIDPREIAISAGVGTILLLAGLYYFRRVERKFADVI